MTKKRSSDAEMKRVLQIESSSPFHNDVDVDVDADADAGKVVKKARVRASIAHGQDHDQVGTRVAAVDRHDGDDRKFMKTSRIRSSIAQDRDHGQVGIMVNVADQLLQGTEVLYSYKTGLAYAVGKDGKHLTKEVKVKQKNGKYKIEHQKVQVEVAVSKTALVAGGIKVGVAGATEVVLRAAGQGIASIALKGVFNAAYCVPFVNQIIEFIGVEMPMILTQHTVTDPINCLLDLCTADEDLKNLEKRFAIERVIDFRKAYRDNLPKIIKLALYFGFTKNPILNFFPTTYQLIGKLIGNIAHDLFTLFLDKVRQLTYLITIPQAVTRFAIDAMKKIYDNVTTNKKVDIKFIKKEAFENDLKKQNKQLSPDQLSEIYQVAEGYYKELATTIKLFGEVLHTQQKGDVQNCIERLVPIITKIDEANKKKSKASVGNAFSRYYSERGSSLRPMVGAGGDDENDEDPALARWTDPGFVHFSSDLENGETGSTIHQDKPNETFIFLEQEGVDLSDQALIDIHHPNVQEGEFLPYYQKQVEYTIEKFIEFGRETDEKLGIIDLTTRPNKPDLLLPPVPPPSDPPVPPPSSPNKPVLILKPDPSKPGGEIVPLVVDPPVQSDPKTTILSHYQNLQILQEAAHREAQLKIPVGKKVGTEGLGRMVGGRLGTTDWDKLIDDFALWLFNPEKKRSLKDVFKVKEKTEVTVEDWQVQSHDSNQFIRLYAKQQLALIKLNKEERKEKERKILKKETVAKTKTKL